VTAGHSFEETMQETIKVYVCKYPDRDNLVMLYRDPYTGRQVTKSAKTPNGKAAAKAAAVWEDELRTGRYKAPSRVTWDEFRDKYESEVLGGLAKNTEIKVSGILDALETILSPARVRDVTSDRLSFYISRQRKNGLAESTLAGHVGHIRAALAYAVEWGYLAKLPELPRQYRAKRSKTMKGRPITGEEFERMLACTAAVVGADAADSWQRLLRGLWLGGLRLNEVLRLRWNDAPAAIVVDMGGRRPTFRIPAESEKGNRDRILPIAPEFVELLEATPKAERTGPVFRLAYRRTGRGAAMGMQWVSAVISKIGKRAGVIVNTDTGKTASAHDLRRSFGQRWSTRVMPAVLQQLMRHEDINTTLKFYVGSDAEAIGDVLWSAVNNLVNTAAETVEK
jgi:integrase